MEPLAQTQSNAANGTATEASQQGNGYQVPRLRRRSERYGKCHDCDSGAGNSLPGQASDRRTLAHRLPVYAQDHSELALRPAHIGELVDVALYAGTVAGLDSSVLTEGYRLTDISPRAFQHPADRAATAALGSIPYLDTVVRKLIELGYERALRQSYLGSSVRLSEEQLGDVYREHAIAYATLDMDEVPDLYLTQYPAPNALAIGARKPIVVVQSELVQLLDAPQRRAVFAHEAAHILSDHQLYRTALAILVLLTRSARLPLPLAPVRSALMEWGRATELSADRAAALVTRDPLVVCRTLMSLAAGAMVDQLDLDLFMRQGIDYKEKGSGLERLTRLMLDLGVTHPMPVKRTHELMEWVRSGEYDRIAGGEYIRRSDPVDPRADSSDAVTFYSERIRDGFRDAGESVNSVGKQLAGWLRRDGDGGEAGETEES
jgi:Zn-dependent protease with chaperone function